jgi:hypothetical protein
MYVRKNEIVSRCATKCSVNQETNETQKADTISSSLIFTCGSKYLVLWLLYGPENFMFESGEVWQTARDSSSSCGRQRSWWIGFSEDRLIVAGVGTRYAGSNILYKKCRNWIQISYHYKQLNFLTTVQEWSYKLVITQPNKKFSAFVTVFTKSLYSMLFREF